MPPEARSAICLMARPRVSSCAGGGGGQYPPLSPRGSHQLPSQRQALPGGSKHGWAAGTRLHSALTLSDPSSNNLLSPTSSQVCLGSGSVGNIARCASGQLLLQAREVHPCSRVCISLFGWPVVLPSCVPWSVVSSAGALPQAQENLSTGCPNPALSLGQSGTVVTSEQGLSHVEMATSPHWNLAEMTHTGDEKRTQHTLPKIPTPEAMSDGPQGAGSSWRCHGQSDN